MAFRIRDLLIAQCDPEQFRTCLPKSHYGWYCPVNSTLEPLIPQLLAPTPEELAQLKERLKQEVRAIEKLEEKVGQPMHPATLAEATRLERELKGALTEIGKIKANLRKAKLRKKK